MSSLKNKLLLIGSAVVSLFAVAVSAVATAAWFQINNTVEPGQLSATKNLQTNVSVHQNNAHSNDDTYQTSPTSDSSGTLSYDHAQGGTATHYYLREYNSSGVEVNTTQMYTNMNALTDKAVIYNFTFATSGSYCFKIYNSSDTNNATAYYGYSALTNASPCYDDFDEETAGGYGDNISTGVSGAYYDIYLNDSSQIYIKRHGEVTTSDEMGNETGWYICGNNSSDPKSSLRGMDGTVATGIPMYVNAAKANDTSKPDKAYYAGLRVSPGDVFWIMSGDDLSTKYTTKATGSDGNFTHNASGISVGANGLGYYTVALNFDSEIYIHDWDGKEVDSTTHYTAEVPAGSGTYRSTPKAAPHINRAPTYNNTKLNYIKFECTSDPGNAHWYIHLWGGASNTTYPGIYLGGGKSSFVSDRIDASAYVGWTGYKISRWSAKGGTEWNASGDQSCSANSVNFWKVNGNSGVSITSREYFAVVQKYYVRGTVVDSSPTGDPAEVWNNATYNPGTPTLTGYTYGGKWYTDSACTSQWNNGSINKDRNLYAKFTANSVNLVYTTNNFSSSSSYAGTFDYSTSTYTWSRSFAAGSKFYLHRSTPSSYWHADCMRSGSLYFGNDNPSSPSSGNFFCYYAGSFTITLDLDGNVNISMNSITASQFYVTDTSGNRLTSSTCTANGSYTVFTINNVVIPKRGTLFHVRDSKASGWAVFGGKDSTTYSSNFTFKSSSSLSGTDGQYNLSATYECKVNIVFNLSSGVTSCTVVSNSVEQYPAQFIIQTYNGVTKGNTTTYNSTDKLFTMSNVELNAGEEFAVKVITNDSGVCNDGFWGYPQLDNPTITVNGTSSCSKGDYFVQGSHQYDSKYYIVARYHGVYQFVFSLDNHKITSATITLDSDNFAMVGYGYSFGNYARSFSSTDAIYSTASDGTNTLTYAALDLKISDKFKFLDGAGVYLGFSSIVNDSSTNNFIKYLKADNDGNIVSRVDLTLTMTVTFNPTDPDGSTVTLTACTENTNITFKHARNSGIYIEIADNSSFTNSRIQMMHTTSNDSYRAQEAPVVLSSGTYFRIFETHSNTTAENNTLTTDAAIRAATEYYYYTLDNAFSGFTQGASYITAAGGRWTLSLTTSTNRVHIDNYSGASTLSTEHHVPYYLVGRGMPGSGIRGCDYTIAKGIQLYTWGNNTSNLGCYVGAYGTNTSSSNYKGTGISLKAGDVFRFSTASNLITNSQSVTSNANYSITAAGQVTINSSGTYLVYLTGTEGSEVIHVELSSAGTNWTRDGDTVAQSKSGVSLIGANGNTLSFGGNLDYSLLDAYGSNGYTFVICLEHVSASAGTLTYTITNGNSTYSIKVAKYNGNYNVANVYSNEITIAASGSNSTYTRSISGTSYTCLQVTIPADQIRTMISSGSYTFNMSISYAFVETTIS